MKFCPRAGDTGHTALEDTRAKTELVPSLTDVSVTYASVAYPSLMPTQHCPLLSPHLTWMAPLHHQAP